MLVARGLIESVVPALARFPNERAAMREVCEVLAQFTYTGALRSRADRCPSVVCANLSLSKLGSSMDNTGFGQLHVHIDSQLN